MPSKKWDARIRSGRIAGGRGVQGRGIGGVECAKKTLPREKKENTQSRESENRKVIEKAHAPSQGQAVDLRKVQKELKPKKGVNFDHVVNLKRKTRSDHKEGTSLLQKGPQEGTCRSSTVKQKSGQT